MTDIPRTYNPDGPKYATVVDGCTVHGDAPLSLESRNAVSEVIAKAREKLADEKPWLSGKPYYCALCGAGGSERMSCEMPDCVLESEATAKARATTSTTNR